jgi:voltage-gated potassium channel
MKTFALQVAMFLESRTARRNLLLLRKFLLFLLAMMLAYGIAFHFIMEAEGQRHSWVSGFYWTLVTMTTLGYGDITFQSDLGRAFSMLVLALRACSSCWWCCRSPSSSSSTRPGWRRSRACARRAKCRRTHRPRDPHPLRPVSISLIERLRYHGREYVVLEPDLQRALELHDEGVRVMVGERDDMETYRACARTAPRWWWPRGRLRQHQHRLHRARADHDVPIVAGRARAGVGRHPGAGGLHAGDPAPGDAGPLAGPPHLGGDVRANVIGRFGELLIAEAPVTGTPLVGKLLARAGCARRRG